MRGDALPPSEFIDRFGHPRTARGKASRIFTRAHADGKLVGTATDDDIAHLAYLSQTLVSEGARHWAAGAFGDRSFAAVVGRDIFTLIAGYQRS